MKRTLCLASSLLLMVSASSAAVTYAFDSSMGDFGPGAAATANLEDNTLVSWSDWNGGSLLVSFDPGWKDTIVRLDLNSNPELAAEYEASLLRGGKITYKLYVVSDQVVRPDGNGGMTPAPGYMEPMYIGNSDGIWDLSFKTAAGQPVYYGAGAFPAGQIQTFDVSYEIEAATSATADNLAQFNPSSGWDEVFLGVNSGGTGFTGARFYIDDFAITANQVQAPIVIPTMDIQRPKAGLTLSATDGSQWSRQSVRTNGSGYSWVGQAGPVTYTLGLADMPNAAGFDAFIYLVPGADIPATNNAPDYAQAVCAVLAIHNNGDGTASTRFSYKDHIPESNGPAGHQYWEAVATPDDGLGGAYFYANGILNGEWSLTFNGDTGVSITGPGGAVGTASMLASTAAKFAGPLYVYWGIWPTTPTNIGLSARFTKVAISGLASGSFMNDFSSGTLQSQLEEAGQVNASINIFGPATPYLLSWSLPDSLFVLNHSTDLGMANSWVPLGEPLSTWSIGGRRYRVIQSTEITDRKNNFFQLRR